MRQLKVAILGQGRSGRDIHGRHLLTDTERFKVVAVVDPLSDRRERAKREYGCDAFEHHSALYGRKDIDIIINATPSHLHVETTLDLLKNGFHVLCDKPFARRAGEVDAMITAAKENNRLLAVFQQSRFALYYRKVKEVIDSGKLGRIVQISIAFNGFARRWDWQCVQEFNGGNLLNTGPHPLDQALQLLNYDGMPNVFCKMDRANTFGDAEDYVKLVMTAPDRPLIDLEISSCCAFPSFTYNVQGTKGGLKGSMEHIEWKYFKPEEAPDQTLIRTPLMKEDGTPAYCGETLTWYDEKWDVSEEKKDVFVTCSLAFYSMLYHAVVEGAPLEITPMQVRQQIAVIEECHRQNPLD